MKHVFPTSEVPHLWAHQIQSDARNPGGNLYFKGPTIYSYRDSWPLARIYTKGRGAKTERLVLTNSDRASVTTSGHQYAVNQACSHFTSVAVPRVESDYYAGKTLDDTDHAKNLDYFKKQIAKHLDKATRVMTVRAVEWRAGDCMQLAQDAKRYAAFFGIRRKVAQYPDEAFNAAEDRARRIETPDPVRDAAKIRERERRAACLEVQIAEYRVKLAEHCALHNPAWRAGGSNYIPQPDWWDVTAMSVRKALCGSGYGNWSRWFGSYSGVGAVMLRVNGEEIETSQGARIPLDHAPRIWALVQACRSAGRAYARNGHTEHAGKYAIDAVSAEGELKVGCHVIPYSEIELLARTLKLIPEGSL